jgi:hypothetical protein
VEIDTPESYQPRCEAELVKTLEAKERLHQLLDSGKILTRQPAPNVTRE